MSQSAWSKSTIRIQNNPHLTPDTNKQKCKNLKCYQHRISKTNHNHQVVSGVSLGTHFIFLVDTNLRFGSEVSLSILLKISLASLATGTSSAAAAGTIGNSQENGNNKTSKNSRGSGCRRRVEFLGGRCSHTSGHWEGAVSDQCFEVVLLSIHGDFTSSSPASGQPRRGIRSWRKRILHFERISTIARTRSVVSTRNHVFVTQVDSEVVKQVISQCQKGKIRWHIGGVINDAGGVSSIINNYTIHGREQNEKAKRTASSSKPPQVRSYVRSPAMVAVFPKVHRAAPLQVTVKVVA